MARRFAISDIHGCSATFRKMVEEVLVLEQADTLYLLGDYVDRGPDSKGVLDYIFDLMGAQYQLHCIRGNHEQMMIDAFSSSSEFNLWYRQGGKETLESFKAEKPDEIPKKYLEFVDSLPYYFDLNDYLLVHAGINFTAENPLEDQRGMMWIRPWQMKIDRNWLGTRSIIHGHTPIDKTQIQSELSLIDQERVLGIDNGCFRIGDPGKGALCAFDLDERSFFFTPNIDGGWTI